MPEKDEQVMLSLLDFQVDKPWHVIKTYPEVAWKALKTLHDENLVLKAENERLRSAAKMSEVLNNCGESKDHVCIC